MEQSKIIDTLEMYQELTNIGDLRATVGNLYLSTNPLDMNE